MVAFPRIALAGLAFFFGVFSSVQAQGSSTAQPASVAALFGTEKGLYAYRQARKPELLWSEGEVRKILSLGDSWAIIGDRGIAVSKDLVNWEYRNEGLPVKTIKSFDGQGKSFLRVVQELKDLERDPQNSETLATATKDAVYLSRNGGRNWKSLGFPPLRTNGIKAVAVVSAPELTVFLSHSIYGVHYIHPDKAGAKWTELSVGLERLETTKNPDEVSDLLAVLPAGRADSAPELYAVQTFRGRVYRLDWNAKAFRILWTDGNDFGAADSLDADPTELRFIHNGGIVRLPRDGAAPVGGAATSGGAATIGGAAAGAAVVDAAAARIAEIAGDIGSFPLCVYLPTQPTAPQGIPAAGIQLSELWHLRKDRETSNPRLLAANGKHGLYLPVNHALDQKSLAPYLATIDAKKLNMVVIDMKDDNGRLRFAPKNAAIAAKGRVFNPLDLERFVETMKAHGVYLVARIVVFKDPELAKKDGGAYAVWDGVKNEGWQGYYETKRRIETAPVEEYETVRTNYDEKWVDPYSEVVWEYTAAISRELHERGFDEIQYDYIRFPTDGLNLGDARYRWRDPGMDMESAIVSFLRHIRSRLDAPISIDIYGANGWYRTGARTGQEVELLARYVDVICPMYYPSHFEQDFLAHEPPEQRPYRIYYQGTQRNDLIARGRIVVRPYVQSFYLNVSYDRKYYGADYVRLQVEGVRDAGNPGLTYWNNVGRYDEIPLPQDLRTAQRLRLEAMHLD